MVLGIMQGDYTTKIIEFVVGWSIFLSINTPLVELLTSIFCKTLLFTAIVFIALVDRRLDCE